MIRVWERKDNAAIEALERECFSDPWNLSMLDDCFLAADFYGLVCEEDGAIVGYVGARFDLWDAEILLVAVSESHRRRGIAEKLMSDVIDRFIKTGKENIFLEVRASNAAAQSLYYKLGFVKVGVREKYYEYTEDAFVLKKALR